MRMAAISHTCRAGRGNRELSDSRRKAAGARTLCGPVQSTKPLFTSAGAISEAQNENAFVAWHAGGFAARGLLLRFGRLAHDPSKKKKQASLSSTRGSRGQAEPEDGGTPIFCRARYVVMHPQMVGRAKTCPVRVMRNTGAGFEYMRYVRVLEGNRSPSLEVSLF